MKKECMLVVLLVITSHSLFAQDQLRFRNYTTRDGLSHNEVNCLMSDTRGFLWIGTTFGLNRFDGVTFEKWYHRPGDSTSLHGNGIHGIVEDRQNRIWVATEDGISIYHIHTGKFNSFQQIQTSNAGIISLQQPVLLCDTAGDIWIGNSTGALILFKAREQQYFNIPVAVSPPGVIQNEFVSSCYQDRRGRIWVSTSYGLYRIDKDQLAVHPVTNSLNNRADQWYTGTDFFETSNGTLLCGTWNTGYLIFDESSQTFVPAGDRYASSVLSPAVFTFGQFENTVFISSLNGLFTCDEIDLRKHIFQQRILPTSASDDPTAIASTSIHEFLTDRNGLFWVAGNKGIALLNENHAYYKTYAYHGLTQNKGEAPRSLIQDGNQLLVGVGRELLRFNLEKKELDNELVQIDGSGFHQFMYSGQHYYQPNQTGIVVYDRDFNVTQKITHQQPDGKWMNYYLAMEDHVGNVWMATSRFGLQKMNAAGKITSYLENPQAAVNSVGDMIGDLLEDKAGNIFAGGKALFMLKNGENEFTSLSLLQENKSNEIRAMKMRDSIIWIGSRNGLFTFNTNTAHIHPWSLPTDVNQTIEELQLDQEGNVWMVTPSGLVRFNPLDSTTMVFNEQNGWPSTFSTLLRLQDGRLAAGCEGQLLIIDPAFIQMNADNPKPYITQINIDETVQHLMPRADTTFKIQYNQTIRFHYISLTYHNIMSNKYAWQLMGLDDRWHYSGSNGNQPFASLAPGHYIFNVKAANANNTWSDISSVQFIVTPPFYRTAWFVILMVCLISGTMYWLYRYRLQKALQVERMRTRIATDLHDDIGATLSSISFYSEAVHQKTKHTLPEVTPILEKMGETSRGMVSSMSDIVWAINPQNDDMSKMLQRMKSYVNELATLTGKSIAIHIDNNAHDLKLQLEQRKNIYLIFKEALNNALKYANSHQIQVDVGVHGNSLHLKIADDGKGFDLQAETEGNGIRNMQRRAEEIGGQFQIRSAANEGTAIELNAVIA